MPLPQKVIEQLGRAPALTPGWSSRILMVSSTIFFLVLGVYVGIAFGMTPYVEGEINSLKRASETATNAVSDDDRVKIQVFHSQIANIKTLLEKHATLLRLLEWLERNTQENVAYNRLEIRLSDRKAVFGGAAKTVKDFVDQTHRYEQDPDVKSFEVRSISASEKNGWLFDATLTFDPDFFKQSAVMNDTPPPSAEVPADTGEAPAAPAP
ncbi:MAG: hypothetical protein RL681_490 [Candidatus Parcubacteria bacterium]|jgi:hypothetical protein